MTIMELGALGEFVGSIAVVATLIFLALQIRQLNKLAIANEVAAQTQRRINVNETMATTDLARVVGPLYTANWPGGQRLRDEFELDIEDFFRAHCHNMAYMAMWEHQYLSTIDDVSGAKGGWRFKAEFGATMASPFNQRWWEEMNPIFDRRFASAVDGLFASIRSRDPKVLGERDAATWELE